MSDDGFSEPYDDPSMDLIIETLTGTTFEMRVYPTDTVIDIKNKIQRVEGIPVQHQNLLFQMRELQDFALLSDTGIANGSVIKLVLSVRGGPISTRRLNPCEHHINWKELKELIEHTRDEGGERNSKVSVLAFKDGEVLNLVRVVENEDGSYSPYSSVKGHPVVMSKTVMAQSLQQREACKDQMREKFKKMAEDMDMASKVHSLKCQMRRAREMRVAKDHGGRGYMSHLVPPHAEFDYYESADDDIDELALKEKHRSQSSSNDNLRNLHVFDPERRELMPPFPMYRDTEEGAAPTAHNRLRLARVGLMVPEDQDVVVDESVSPKQNLTAYSATTQCKFGFTGVDYEREFGLGIDPSGAEEDPDDWVYRFSGLPRFTTAASMQTAEYLGGGQFPDKVVSRSPLYGRCSRNSNDNFLPPTMANSPSFEMDKTNISNIERLQNDCLEFEEYDPEVYGYYNSDFDKYITSGIAPNSSALAGSSGLDVGSNYFNIDEELDYETINLTADIKKLTIQESSVVTLPKVEAEEIPVASVPSVIESAKRDLPAVVTKKRVRCGQCNKRLNITNIYNCRCGRIFCSQHRYSESHDCKYDYKSEGRKLLEQQNPLVAASKLTKF